MNENKPEKDPSESILNFVKGFMKTTGLIFKICSLGANRIPKRSIVFWLFTVEVSYILFCLVKEFKHFELIESIYSNSILNKVMLKTASLGFGFNFILVALFLITASTFVLGLKDFKKAKDMAKAFSDLGIKSPDGKDLRVVNLQELDEFRSIVTVFAGGISPSEFQKKKENIKTKTGLILQSALCHDKDPRYIEIRFASKDLPQKNEYKDFKDQLTNPYEVIVGESLWGLVKTQILNPPHFLLAGATGSGKSSSFRALILSLLKTSDVVKKGKRGNGIKLELIDLKNGVELKPFANLPCSTLSKNEFRAKERLEQIKKEMNRRYDYLEKKGYNEIDPKRDNLPRIYVIIDEASVLYTVPKGLKEKKDAVHACRDLTNDISKLGRAAGIHLVLGTQKVDKSAVDPQTRENIDLRLAFKANSVPGSNEIIGSKDAYHLPEHRGRAIWRNGNKLIEVQVPYLSQAELAEELKEIEEEYKEYDGNVNLNGTVSKSEDDEYGTT